MTKGSYSIFDHTGDIGIEVRAPSPRELYETAALALFDLMADVRDVRPVEQREIRVTAVDREELLVRWLSELLYLHDTDGLLFSCFRIHDLSGGRISATALGEAFDPERHQPRAEIKAVTYHQASVKEEDGAWKARIVLDV